MLKKISFVLFSIFLCSAAASAQEANFAEKCLGTWQGTMHIYAAGALRDKVEVRLTVAKTAKPGDYQWKTEYLSPTRPMTKDYVLRVKDAAKGIYVTDEGGGVELVNYLFENKLYNVFEVQGVLLTATYELRGDELIFEVTSGRKPAPDAAKPVIDYPVTNLQRVVFKKSK